MWSSLWNDGDIRICVIGVTDQFRFVVKCCLESAPKIFICEGGQWNSSTAEELSIYLDAVESWDAVIHHRQMRGWVKTTTRVTRLCPLRN
jgi:hypothetical protein